MQKNAYGVLYREAKKTRPRIARQRAGQLHPPGANKMLLNLAALARRHAFQVLSWAFCCLQSVNDKVLRCGFEVLQQAGSACIAVYSVVKFAC